MWTVLNVHQRKVFEHLDWILNFILGELLHDGFYKVGRAAFGRKF
jgi:hypothetical protein